MQYKNLVGLWVNLSRAYEIALLGNYSIQVAFDKEYKQGFEDYEQIKLFYKGVDFVKDGDLIVEIYKPEYNDKINYETRSDIISRVNSVRQMPIPKHFSSGACDSLLKTATERLDFSLKTTEKVKKISSTIAQLAKSETIRPEHVAEAIQYNTSYADDICNAESKSIFFGKGIEIALHELDHSDIQNAVEYLKSLYKS